MKLALFASVALSLLVTPAMAENQAPSRHVIKTCETTLTFPESEPVPTSIQIFNNLDGTYSTNLTQTVQGFSAPVYENQKTTLDVYPVRAGLKGADFTKDNSGLNFGERIIDGAIGMANDPITQDIVNTGLDLKAVRSVTVYNFTRPEDNIGMSTVVEARDEQGNPLGSFFGGGLIFTPCR